MELGNQGASENPVSCTLLQNFNPLSSGASARDAVITAVKIGTLHVQSSAP